MFQKFFTDTYVSKTIKNLIKNTNLYTLPTVNYGDYLVQDCEYIFKYNIIRCKESGYLYNINHNYVVLGGINDQTYTPNYHHNVNSEFGYYDTRTHIYLGRYLRQYKDLYDIDLMPFYNCFSYQMEKNRVLAVGQNKTKDENNNTIITQQVVLEPFENKAYKVFLVPIFFNKTYTIAIDSPTEILMKPVIYDDLGPIKNYNLSDKSHEYIHDYINNDPSTVTYDQYENIIDDDEHTIHNSQYIKHGSQFSNPYTINVNIGDGETAKILYKYYHNLYLMIQLDVNNTSSIVILEGDYTKSSKKTILSTNKEDRLIYDGEEVTKYPEIENLQLNESYLSDLSLLNTNDGNSYPFSDRLMEYLVNSVVTQIEYLDGNIQKLQEALKLKTKSIGIWDDSLRSYLYSYYMNEPEYAPMDDNGYLNKDVEKLFIQKGRMQ